MKWTSKKADFLMVLAVVFWGASYVFTKYGLSDLPVFTFISIRMALGFVIAALVCYKTFSKVNTKTLVGGAILGMFLFLTLTGTNYGLLYTPISNAVFLISLTALFVPLISTIIYRKLPEKKIIIGSLAATVGIILLTFTSAAGIGRGDILCITASVIYAGHILFAKKWVEKEGVNPLNLGIAQLGFTALYGTVAAFLFEEPCLPETADVWMAVLFLGLFSVAFGCVAQIVAQKHTSAAHIGLIFALEPLFGAAFAFLIYGEMLLPLQIVGGAIVFSSVVWIETNRKDFRKIRKKKNVS